MKDLPIFPCADGLASLILCEIPYRSEAYILVRAVYGSLNALVRQCANFCKDAGAKHIYVSGEGDFSAFPIYTRLLDRSVETALLPPTAAHVEQTDSGEWVTLYNERFRSVPCAKTYRETPENACFIYGGDTRIGLGLCIEDELAAVASFERGRGADCVLGLAKQIKAPRIKLLCAEENTAAMRLYDRLGFSVDGVRRIWYHVGMLHAD
ncbi:MAG: GNAT family N-acetyltransferase [Faecousia sp.]